MNEDSPKAPLAQPRADDKTGASLTNRRTLLKTGLAASPLIATLASRPAWAATKCTISGNLSGNLSNADAVQETCTTEEIPQAEGLSPGYWQNWEGIYSFIKDNPEWKDSFASDNKSPFSDKGKGSFNGDGQPLTVLYNWSRATPSPATLSELGLSTIKPTVPNGDISSPKSHVGGVLTSPFNSKDYDVNHSTLANLYAAILSASLPGSEFPLPEAQPWSDLYIAKSYTDLSTHDQLLTMLEAFFDGNHPEPSLLSFPGTPKEAYLWARNYLFGIPETND